MCDSSGEHTDTDRIWGKMLGANDAICLGSGINMEWSIESQADTVPILKAGFSLGVFRGLGSHQRAALSRSDRAARTRITGRSEEAHV